MKLGTLEHCFRSTTEMFRAVIEKYKLSHCLRKENFSQSFTFLAKRKKLPAREAAILKLKPHG